MKQAVFEKRYGADWRRLEIWLDARDRRRRRSADTPLPTDSAQDVEVPQLYRRVCQHLALARDRHYSPDLVDRLNGIALRGHHVLYGAQGRDWGLFEFLARGFPRLIRAEGRFVVAACAVLFVPFIVTGLALQWHPEFIYYLVDSENLQQFQGMHDPAGREPGVRGADSNVGAFGMYIWNNIRIGFNTFATGLAFGLGTLAMLLFNGIFLGAVAGHLHGIGYGSAFWPFVAGHSALELVGIAVSGAAGFKLGGALISPGPYTRKMALVRAAQTSVRLMYGAALMIFAAAFIEGFWSPHTAIPAGIKYGVGIAFWLLVIVYFLFAGRGKEPSGGA
jgi:uncharacterized membrane protein SpoIIM required for sporulation